MHWEAQDLSRGSFDHRQSALMNRDAVLISRLQMYGDRILDERPHALLAQMLAQTVAVLAARDVLMIDALDSVESFRQSERSRRQPLIVSPRDLSSTRVLFVQVFQLHAKDRGLQFVQPRIEAGDVAHVSLAPAIFAQQADAFGEDRKSV